MNIRKYVDYSEMYAALDMAVTGEYDQMQMYLLIGQAVCQRTEKGAAVAASEYLQSRYPDMSGFSPRSLRRMRNFYHIYAGNKKMLKLAMKVGWSHNIIILEANLTMQERVWYLKKIAVDHWSKTMLIESIQNGRHLDESSESIESIEVIHDLMNDSCDSRGTEEVAAQVEQTKHGGINGICKILKCFFPDIFTGNRYRRQMWYSSG
ncbi:MAG: hypothetical protein IKC03_02625 [Oscillospiraceae bacterium]|nr:hypothetical protein [Oscillospiraceae bacterium]